MRSAILATAVAAAAALSGTGAVVADPYPQIPIYDADSYSTVLNKTDNGVLQLVTVPSPDGGPDAAQSLHVMHLYGSPTEMGRAHGQLLGSFALDFLENGLPAFFVSEIDSIDSTGLPEWLKELVEKAVAPAAPEIFDVALQYVYSVQQKYLESSPSKVLDELAGMAQGLCESGAVAGECNVGKWTNKLVRLNMLPELIRMSCSIVGATGKATPSGGLNQLRALDFGGGPFANYSVLTVYHPDDGNDFASVGFAGFANLVTGISEYVGVSEKVHMTYNGSGLQPGTYHGRAVATVMREMIQFSNTTAQAIEHARGADRTWSVFLGMGDTGNNFDVLQYHESAVDVFDWRNITNVTESVPIEDIAYVDRHPQPTHDPDMMPTILKNHYGNLSIETFSQLPQQLGPTGDVHIAIYDYPNQKMLVSVGQVDVNGTYGPNDEGMACHRPFLRFDLKELWGYEPSSVARGDATCGESCESDDDCDQSQPCRRCENMILHQCVT